MEERRKFLRFGVIMNAFYGMHGSFYPKKPCFLKDISREGIRMTTDTPLKKGQLFEFDIEIPGEDTKIIAVGESLWWRRLEHETFDNGLTVKKIARHNRTRILDYASNEWITGMRDQYVTAQKTA
ncbi:MAG: PilZ domain-containing protein [Candidatus Omnitrophica bacterium]|nr:PilZ domain-containing protein [Candidatus Omnitrophota bacterium]